MRNYLVFDGLDSRDFGVYISGSGVYNSPARVVNALSVPGRNGDLLIPGGKFENIEVTYPAFIYTNFKQNLADFRSALSAVSGYGRLEDTYHTDEYRLAYFAEGIEVDARSQNDAGEFEIIFNCKPQRFLTSGETKQTVSSGGSITNPTRFNSKPLIRVTGYGTLTVGSDVITIANNFAYVDIDSEVGDCYHGTDNANASVSFQQNDFPELAPGATGIAYSGHITKVEITPRWWRL